MGFTGSTKLAVARLRELHKIPSKAAPKVAARINERLRDQAANETDPYGKPLAALKASTIRRKAGNSVILYRTGKMWNGTSAKPMRGSGVQVTYGQAAQYAQEGDPGRGRVPRMVAPTYGIPAKWRRDIEDVLRGEVQAVAT